MARRRPPTTSPPPTRELSRPVELQAPAAKWAKRVPGVVAATKTHPTRVAQTRTAGGLRRVPLPAARVRGAAALLDSLVEHASRPVRLWALAPPDSPVDRLTAAFPEVTINVDPARAARQPRPPAQSGAPARPDPGRRRGSWCCRRRRSSPPTSASSPTWSSAHDALAAPTRLGTTQISGFGVINTAANRLRDSPAAAAELRRAALARHGFDFDAFSLAPLVLDLGRLRREGFMDEGLRLASTFRLNDVEILHFLTGPDRAQVPARWAAVPTRTPERGPRPAALGRRAEAVERRAHA